MINDTSQRRPTVAMWFSSCSETFDHYFVTNLPLSTFWKDFWNSSTFGKVVGKVHCLKLPVDHGTLLLKVKDEELACTSVVTASHYDW